VRIAKDCGE